MLPELVVSSTVQPGGGGEALRSASMEAITASSTEVSKLLVERVRLRSRATSRAGVQHHADPPAEQPDGLQREIVANCCRGALEAAAHAKVRRVRLGRGEAHLDVDAALASAVKVQEKMTLAVFDDPTRGGDLLNCLNNKVGRWAGDTLQACKKGAHRAYVGDMKALVDDTRRLAEWTLR